MLFSWCPVLFVRQQTAGEEQSYPGPYIEDPEVPAKRPRKGGKGHKGDASKREVPTAADPIGLDASPTSVATTC